MFSAGVILFIIVQGIFPFSEAKSSEYFYDMLIRKDYTKYWAKTAGQSLTNDFKDLMQKMLSYDPSERPTVEQLVNHPWMRTKVDNKVSIKIMDAAINTNQFEKASTEGSNSKGKSD